MVFKEDEQMPLPAVFVASSDVFTRLSYGEHLLEKSNKMAPHVESEQKNPILSWS